MSGASFNTVIGLCKKIQYRVVGREAVPPLLSTVARHHTTAAQSNPTCEVTEQ